jgi:two-component system KDP operon response regulator KdpE
VACSSTERRQELRRTLEFEGHEVTEAPNAFQAIQEACSDLYDLLLVDGTVDGAAALALCRAIRPESTLGILVLGRDSAGAVDALNAGADDYVSSPFVMAELAARVRSILRRVAPRQVPRQIVLDDRLLDLEARRITGPGLRVSRLTPKEFLVLNSLLAHANTLRTYENLAQTVWRDVGHGELECLRTVVNRLRLKIEPDPKRPRYILTERSVGYQFRLPDRSPERSGERPIRPRP